MEYFLRGRRGEWRWRSPVGNGAVDALARWQWRRSVAASALLQQCESLHGRGRGTNPGAKGKRDSSVGSGINGSEESGVEWRILRRWEVPWDWQTVSLTSLACVIGFLSTGVMDAIHRFKPDVLSLNVEAVMLLLDIGITTAVILGIIYSVADTFQPLPEDFFKYDLREPFNLQKGWLLWAGVGLVSAFIANVLTRVAVSIFSGGPPKGQTDALVILAPLVGSSNLGTACRLVVSCVLIPLLEETVFRGFLMTSLTKWVPTPVAVVIISSLFALAHLRPAQFPHIFVIGSVLGFSYAQTRNLLTPITIHAFWNLLVIYVTFFSRKLDGNILSLTWM
ncbi:uncharacterized protein LOC114168973 [Vigna unguiculata]|uniref:uncharacterized protein LOC114168973 n=1 Tax=Vigna unguiculata TaxID=3917 RepID=UPI001015D4AC|nr:uncharacterized protein LOC114168973 [Vigna unguiculata]